MEAQPADAQPTSNENNPTSEPNPYGSKYIIAEKLRQLDIAMSALNNAGKEESPEKDDEKKFDGFSRTELIEVLDSRVEDIKQITKKLWNIYTPNCPEFEDADSLVNEMNKKGAISDGLISLARKIDLMLAKDLILLDLVVSLGKPIPKETMEEID